MTQKKLYISLLICTIVSIAIVILLFAFTNRKLQPDMSFKRAVIHDGPKKNHELDLGYNHYYIAGADGDKIYLGYPKAPLNLTVVDTTLLNKQEVHITMDQDSLPMRSPQLRIIPPYFFLMDGTIPYILRGHTEDWKAHSILEKPFYFINAQPMDSITLAIRAISSKTKEVVLGTIHLSDSATMTLSHKLLQKQVDGIFDVDGTLQYNPQRQQLLYTYHYRNEFIVANDSLQLVSRGKTIDSISQAKVKVGTIVSKNQKKLAAPALIVNKSSATSGNHLFVNSKILGRNESLMQWQTSSPIDVYNLKNNRYVFSFYVDDIGGNKLRSFYVLNDKFIGLIGNHMVIYQLGKQFKKVETPNITAQNSNPNPDSYRDLKKLTPRYR